LQQLNATLFGLSVQNISYQNEVKNRLHLPFELLSDYNLEFSKLLSLPTMIIINNIFLKRLTLIYKNGIIKKVFYPN
jgi:peroxiredoxin